MGKPNIAVMRSNQGGTTIRLRSSQAKENSSLYGRYLLYNDEFFYLYMEEKNTTSKSDAALREEAILKFWQENKIFEKSLEKKSPQGEFIFYDGPVTANSKPVLHTMEPFAFKDVIPRYKTMRGYHVRRKGGWDTHGLPVELQIEKKLEFKSKNDIEDYGIAAFNKLCKDSVWEYVGLWKAFTKRMGYWADQENAYVTYHNDYIESVWNVVKKINEQKLLYKDYKVVPWCPRCGTALSSHELAQGYEDVKDLSVTAKFKIKGQENTYILAWTTTPWTLPGNVALAVGEDIIYVEVKVGGEILVLAKERLSVITEPYEIITEHKGKEMIGMEYEPLYPYLANTISEVEKPKLEKAYKVYGADFVTTTDGTGIVHTAVMYGQDDFVLGTQIGLPKHHLVGLDGKFLPGTGSFEGRFVKDEEVAVDVIKDLAHRGLLFKKEKYEHSYPHCWRCRTALIYYARDSWYIRMSDPKIKQQLIDENKKINWEPSHIRDGRFGEWLRAIKDWAISRERYWGTPLPVWDCESCKKREVIGSMKELQDKIQKSGNTYFLMRHGQSDNNLENLVSTVVVGGSYLTLEGKKKTKEAAELLKKEDIDMLIISPFTRTKETAKIVQDVLGLKDVNIVVDERLGEMNVKSYEGKTWMEYHTDFPKTEEYFSKKRDGDESYRDVRARTMSVLFDLENKYKDKKILIITHGGPAWLAIAGSLMLDIEHTLTLIRNKKDFRYLENSEVRKLPFVPFPHDKFGNFDLHRPYIDEVTLVCVCGGKLIRTKEVMDVWFDSGAMPFAQDHYPFENKKLIDGPGYPADFISEGLDQTRGWFYTLHAVGILMGRGKAYKNVICLGLLMDAQGKKMSKSVGNVVDPWEMMDKYGVDTLRLWMYAVNQPGESKNFDEKTVVLLHQQVFSLIYNVLAFYELYRDKNLENNSRPKSHNILDQWILARLDELIKLSTESLDNYKLLEPVRAMRDFIGDLSTWYLRRSRERIKDGDIEAKQTLYFVLKTMAKLLTPFAPFAGEDIWQKLKVGGDVESVHLADWPTVPFKLFSFGKNKVITDMANTREIVSTLLKERQQKNIPVRQPLALATGPSVLNIYALIIKEEVNIKDYQGTETFSLDTEITGELKQEGYYRELVRALQDMRKKIGLTPSDVVNISFDTDKSGRELIEKFETDMKKTVLVSKIESKENDGEEVKIGELVFKVKIEK